MIRVGFDMASRDMTWFELILLKTIYIILLTKLNLKPKFEKEAWAINMTTKTEKCNIRDGATEEQPTIYLSLSSIRISVRNLSSIKIATKVKVTS